MDTPHDLANLLKEGEALEFVDKPMKATYIKKYRERLKIALIVAVIVNLGFLYLVFSGRRTEQAIEFLLTNTDSYFGLAVVNVIFVGVFIWTANIVKNAYPKSFYAYTNMRIIFTDPDRPGIKSFYYKDIHELSVEHGEVFVDTGDYVGDYTSTSVRKQHRILGVPKPEDFVAKIDQKLLPFRKPS